MSRPLSSKVPAWFERKFDFTFPAEQYPNVCVRLWGTPARLEEILRKVTTDVLVGKPQEKWSAQDHAGHLLDLEPLWMARVDDFLTDRDTLAVADLGNRKTHEANHNALELAEILAGFRTARLRLVGHLGTFEPDVLRERACIRVSSSPCGSWIICILLRSTMTITWQRYRS